MLDNTEKVPSEKEFDSTNNQKEKQQEINEKVVDAPLKNEKNESKKEAIDNTEKNIVSESSKKAIDEIEDKVAEAAEKDKVEAIQMKDYNTFNLEELVDELKNLIQNNPIQSINENVNKIKNVFNVKFGQLLKKSKEKFISEGGESIDFKFEFPLKTTYNSILYDYKVKRNEFYKNQEHQLNQNLEAKLNLIEALKQLIENADGATMYKKFEEIRTSWRKTGPIPRAKYNDTWRTYYHHTERFYDLLHLNNDLRDLDFKHNLEEKLKLIKRAEELADVEDVSLAFKGLQT